MLQAVMFFVVLACTVTICDKTCCQVMWRNSWKAQLVWTFFGCWDECWRNEDKLKQMSFVCISTFDFDKVLVCGPGQEWGQRYRSSIWRRAVMVEAANGALNIHPRKLTWNLKISTWKRRNIYKPPLFGFHVSFRGCNMLILSSCFSVDVLKPQAKAASGNHVWEGHCST